MLNKKSKIVWILTVTSLFVGVTLFLLAPASAHKKRHSAADMQAFDDAYMEVVKTGDALFHGGGPQEELGITLSKQVWHALCVIHLLQMCTLINFLSSRNK